ncbi:MAG: hypothetical protein O3A80_04695 [bacterium]|nr:hypothetical protein [bacterium]MDA1292549.1 hypothetical protein [bacterium]
MKNTLFALVALTLTLTVGTISVAPAVEAAPYRYAVNNSWPQWIGRIDSPYETYKLRPQMQAKYLPLSLIKTGGMADLIREVENTPNVDTRNWPTWVGDLK